MDDYMFRSYVKDCKFVDEHTSYLEIFNYSVCLASSVDWPAQLDSLRLDSATTAAASVVPFRPRMVP